MSATRNILRTTEHRPWPIPARPWAVAMTWEHLLFAHWPIAASVLRPLVPPALALDTYDGSAWVGVVPFAMTGVRTRCTPALPWFSRFLELNVRTYVTLAGRPGVFFFSLDAANPLAVRVARRWFQLPYFDARMQLTHDADERRYQSVRTHAGAAPAQLSARYRPAGEAYRSAPGAIDHWLTERYRLYAIDARDGVHCCDIHHAPWPLQPARARIEENTMADAAGIDLGGEPQLLHFARRLDVLAWSLEPVAPARRGRTTPSP